MSFVCVYWGVGLTAEPLLVSASYDNTMILWMLEDGEDFVSKAVLQGHTTTVWQVAWSPDGSQIGGC